jgi:hypothetical protein
MPRKRLMSQTGLTEFLDQMLTCSLPVPTIVWRGQAFFAGDKAPSDQSLWQGHLVAMVQWGDYTTETDSCIGKAESTTTS